MTRFLLAALFAAAALPAWAEPPAARFRGTVESADSDRLDIRHPGGALTLRMNPRTRVFAVTAARTRDIKPESYVSVLGASGPDPRRATAVTLYAPSERGFEAGSRPWDTAPGAVFAAGWIAELGLADPGRADALRLTLAYGGGRAAFEIPDGTPVTQIAPGEKAQLEPGAPVTVFARSRPDGALEADTVAVGRRGAVPGL